jgi:hypothetical protein
MLRYFFGGDFGAGSWCREVRSTDDVFFAEEVADFSVELGPGDWD